MTAPTWFVGEVEFSSQQDALDAIGDRPAMLTEVQGASSWTVTVRTETCPICGGKYKVLGVLGALRILAEGRPCGCDDEDVLSLERQAESLDRLPTLVDLELADEPWRVR